MTSETWKVIPEFDDYEASDHGRIRSKSRVRCHKDGNTTRMLGRVLTEMVQSGKGYKRVNLYRSKRMSQHGVHCLVAAAFFGEANGRYVNHIDFDVTNNRLENLEYVTPAGNIQHSARNGRLRGQIGEDNTQAILTADEVQQIAERIRLLERDETIGRDFGVAKGTVTAIRLGKTWSHVTGLHSTSFRIVRGRKRAAEMIACGTRLRFLEYETPTNVARYLMAGA